MGDNDEIKKTAPEEVIAAGGVSRNRRSAGVARYANYRRRRNKESKDVRRSTSSPCPFRDSSTSEMEDEDDDHRTVRKSPSMPQTGAGLEPPVPAVRRPKPLRPKRDDKQSDTEKSEPEKPTTPVDQKESDKNDQKKGVKTVQKEKKSKARQSDGSKSDGEREPAEESSEGWWKNLSNWKRSKSLEPETLEALEQVIAPPRRKSLHRAEEVPEPELRRRKKTKELNTTDDMKLDDTVDDFWKTEMSKLSGQDEEKAKETEVKKEKDSNEDLRSIGSEQTKKDIQEVNLESTEVTETKDIKNVEDPIIQEPCITEEPYIKEKPIAWLEFYKQIRIQYRQFVKDNPIDAEKMRLLRNRCINDFIILFIYCGLGAFMFKFTESAFETFYKCGVKRVKRDFIDQLWRESHYLKEEEWKSNARRKLMEFENQLHEAFEAGMTSYSGQKSWSFLNAVIYCLTVVSTIGYGHIAPATNTGRALTIIYAIFGIPMFLILLADFGKMFTRGIKWIWAFVRRLYYTGSCKKVRKTGPVQEVMKGVQVMYDMATFRRPSQMGDGMDPTKDGDGTPHSPMSGEPPSTPAPSNFAIDDEFNLPVSLAITILLMYILCGAAVFYVWEENWSFFESFYFVFISMSTIGFGDFVPQNKMYMMASIVYLAFGLALTTMCINVVQEKLSDTFRQATAKIGATIGLRVSEEDGTVTPATPAHVELVQVHKSPSQL